jgi:preprotein translocase subunit SecD
MFDFTQSAIVLVLWVVFGVVKIWAFADCVRRPADVFPAVGRVSKVLWLILTGVALLTGLIPGMTLSLIGIAGLIAALVYLFDVRVRIAEISG